MVRFAIATCAAVLTCSSARADLLVPISQSRYTHATARFNFLPPDKHMQFATNFDQFTGLVTATAGLQINATAAQDTSITASSIFGTCNAQSLCSTTGVGSSSGANSIMVVQFEITQTVLYDLSGTFSAFGANQFLANPTLILSVNDTNGPTVEFIQAPSQTTINFSRNGSLLPGTYTLWANIFSGAGDNNSPYSVGTEFNFSVSPTAGSLPLLMMGLFSPLWRRRS